MAWKMPSEKPQIAQPVRFGSGTKRTLGSFTEKSGVWLKSWCTTTVWGASARASWATDSGLWMADITTKTILGFMAAARTAQ